MIIEIYSDSAKRFIEKRDATILEILSHYNINLDSAEEKSRVRLIKCINSKEDQLFIDGKIAAIFSGKEVNFSSDAIRISEQVKFFYK